MEKLGVGSLAEVVSIAASIDLTDRGHSAVSE
jgi:hypothetical protein